MTNICCVFQLNCGHQVSNWESQQRDREAIILSPFSSSFSLLLSMDSYNIHQRLTHKVKWKKHEFSKREAQEVWEEAEKRREQEEEKKLRKAEKKFILIVKTFSSQLLKCIQLRIWKCSLSCSTIFCLLALLYGPFNLTQMIGWAQKDIIIELKVARILHLFIIQSCNVETFSFLH